LFAIQRGDDRSEPLQTSSDGVKVSSAEGMCQMNGNTYSAFYKVIESGQIAIVIMEFATLADQKATRDLNADTRRDAGLLASFPSH